MIRFPLLSGLALAIGVHIGLSLPKHPTSAPEIQTDVLGCDNRPAWRLAAVEALFTGTPRRPDRNASSLGQALCALPDQPPGEQHAREIAADPRAHHSLGQRIHAAWTAYVGEQPALPPVLIDRLRRAGLDVRNTAACIHQVEWLLTDAPFGDDPIARAPNPGAARRLATIRAFHARTISTPALEVCIAAMGNTP